MKEDNGAAVSVGPQVDVDELGAAIGANLRRLRTKQGLSLEALARQAGVSRAMIGQIEGGRSMPTIGLLWKITRALGVPFAALMGGGAGGGMTLLRAERSKTLTSQNGAFTSRALFPFDSERRVEFYELTMEPHAIEEADAHVPGTTENLVVAAGEVEVIAAGQRAEMVPGDALFFHADVPHSYRNLGDHPAVMYLVMTYAYSVG